MRDATVESKQMKPTSCLARWWPQWNWKTWFKLVVSIIAGVALCGFFYWFSEKGYLAVFLEWVKKIGYWGNLLFVIAFTLTGLPFMLIGYTPLGLAAGFIYGQDGPILGILNASVTVLIGTITGSILGFWSCRVLCKGWFQRKINESPTLQAFMHTMESKGFYLILIMRMAPIPFGVQNGLFSVSNVSVMSFSVATIVGLVPEILMLVYMGTTMADLTSIATGDFEFGLWQKIMLGIEIGMTVILFVLLFFLSREAMRKVKERQRQTEMAESLADLEMDDSEADDTGAPSPLDDDDRTRLLRAINGEGMNDDSSEAETEESKTTTTTTTTTTTNSNFVGTVKKSLDKEYEVMWLAEAQGPSSLLVDV
jgi:uncharacterized membrane protein YdjX (TVP38/TMEM64 family)